jgi:hypothetical protein
MRDDFRMMDCDKDRSDQSGSAQHRQHRSYAHSEHHKKHTERQHRDEPSPETHVSFSPREWAS